MAVVTTGFFDGVHLGHRQVLETVVSSARERGEETLVVTFWPHPRMVLQQDARDFRLLSSLEEKKRLILSAGIDRVEVIPFTRSFAALTAQEYLTLLWDDYGASLVVMGYDNRIGSDGKTIRDLMSAEESGVDIEAVRVPKPVAARGRTNGRGPLARRDSGRDEERSDEGFWPLSASMSEEETEPVPISSTRIRKALEEGQIEAAEAMLGYQYELYGAVVPGKRVGRTMGFPTANMQLYEPLKLVPRNGVYAVEVEVLGNQYKGMCNIGLRPTVGGTARTIETHILDFDEDIYGLPLRIRFLRRIRDERRFPSLEALKAQLEQDRIACK